MNEKHIQALIKDIKSTKPLKLSIKGIRDSSPRPIHYYSSKKQFVPDIVAVFSNKKNYYAIENKVIEADIPALTFKWILFSSEARKTSGTFYLVIDKSSATICNDLISEKQLDIEVIVL